VPTVRCLTQRRGSRARPKSCHAATKVFVRTARRFASSQPVGERARGTSGRMRNLQGLPAGVMNAALSVCRRVCLLCLGGRGAEDHHQGHPAIYAGNSVRVHMVLANKTTRFQTTARRSSKAMATCHPTMPAAAWHQCDGERMLGFWVIPDVVDTMPGQCPDAGVFADREYVGEGVQ
jgi:hypothetical protein